MAKAAPGRTLVVVLVLCSATALAMAADTIPPLVMTALTTRFPQARIEKWSKETEDGKQIYDIEFRQGEKKFEADIYTDGTFHNWEQQVAASELPDAVVRTLNKQYPKAAMKEIMAITAVDTGAERLEGYEIVVRRTLRKDIEITIAPDGRILEGPGAQK